MNTGSNKEIREISCDVKNCTYHTQHNTCTAGHIQVGNQRATVSGETLCATFHNRQETGGRAQETGAWG